MKAPFKMKGFSGFGNSPVKSNKAREEGGRAEDDKQWMKDMEAMEKSGEAAWLDKQFDKKRKDYKFVPRDTGPDRPGSSGMYPTGFETKIPRINKLKKLKV
jgi:hypothetical protein